MIHFRKTLLMSIITLLGLIIFAQSFFADVISVIDDQLNILTDQQK